MITRVARALAAAALVAACGVKAPPRPPERSAPAGARTTPAAACAPAAAPLENDCGRALPDPLFAATTAARRTP